MNETQNVLSALRFRLFQNIFKDGTPEQQRAMMKSFVSPPCSHFRLFLLFWLLERARLLRW